MSSCELPIRVLAGVYLDVKREVIDAGFAWEIDWQSNVNLADLTESAFLREAGWVILSSGMSEAVIRKHFAEISAAFMDWCDARRIVRRQSQCRRRALKHFNHPAKIEAILSIARFVATHGVASVVLGLQQRGVEFLREFSYLGPATARHLAKNIGLSTAKADRHLQRIASAFLFPSVHDLCRRISNVVVDAPQVVDVVLWRYATLHPRRYLQQLSALCDAEAVTS